MRQEVRPQVVTLRSGNPGRPTFPASPGAIAKIRPLPVLDGQPLASSGSPGPEQLLEPQQVRAWVLKAVRPHVCGKATSVASKQQMGTHKGGRWARSAPARHGCSAAIGHDRPIECGSWLISIALASSRIQQRQSATSSSQAGRGNRHTPTGGTAITHPFCWPAGRSRTQ